jgi:hypothetical protein
MVNKELCQELSTMQVVATALAGLEPSARTRVLHWLQERFQNEASTSLHETPVPAPAPAPAPAPFGPLRAVPPPVNSPDEALAVGTLDDLFGVPESEAVTPLAAEPITALLHEFVAEFQDIAREWDDACGAPVDGRRPTKALPAAS